MLAGMSVEDRFLTYGALSVGIQLYCKQMRERGCPNGVKMGFHVWDLLKHFEDKEVLIHFDENGKLPDACSTDIFFCRGTGEIHESTRQKGLHSMLQASWSLLSAPPASAVTGC